MTCTKCNGKGYVELFTSREPCECQQKNLEFDDHEEEEEWSVHTPTDGNIVDEFGVRPHPQFCNVERQPLPLPGQPAVRSF